MHSESWFYRKSYPWFSRCHPCRHLKCADISHAIDQAFSASAPEQDNRLSDKVHLFRHQWAVSHGLWSIRELEIPVSQDAPEFFVWVAETHGGTVETWSCEAVADAGLDFHAACERVPHSKRPGTLLRYLRARNWNQESGTPEGTSLELEFALNRCIGRWCLSDFWFSGPKNGILKPVYMGVSINGGTPKSSNLIWFSLI